MKDLNVHVSLLECAVTKKVGGGAPLIREHPRKSADKHVVLQEKEFWLGGLDSNQDSQIQSLESYQLDDLPSVGFAPNCWGSTGKEQKKIAAGFPRIGTAAILLI